MPSRRLRGFLALLLLLGALAAAPGVLAQDDDPRVLAVYLANDINPVFAHAEGHGVTAVDALVVTQDGEG